MHLLVAQGGAIDDGTEAIDLDQSPADVIFLSAADTELALLAQAQRARRSADPTAPTLRLAHLLQLTHNYSVDLYVEKTLRRTKLVVVRVLGGRGYWPYGLEQLATLAANGTFDLVVLPGDDKPDLSLMGLSTLDDAIVAQLWGYLTEGGSDNATTFLEAISAHLNGHIMPPPARTLLKAGLYWPSVAAPTLEMMSSNWVTDAPTVALVFYRALVQSGDLGGADAMVDALRARGLNPLPLFVSSLRDAVSDAVVREVFSQTPPDVILNATAFAASRPGDASPGGPFSCCQAPVFQVVFSRETEAAWADGTRGFGPRDIAMHVSLPEVDGRVLSRAVAFKAEALRDDETECFLTTAVAAPDRADFVAQLAGAWAKLRQTPAQERRIGIVLANYPNRDARLANGVGLDTPASAIRILEAMQDAGYHVSDTPADGNALITALKAGPTNAGVTGRVISERLPLADYNVFFSTLPGELKAAIHARWGAPEDDPAFIDATDFAIGALRFGNVAVAIQPARGYNIDAEATYHDPDLIPPHGYFAFYAWLRHTFGAHAVAHLGKHGNLEWLPGKALALSSACAPEAALGPLPNIYPFIVNDPGEGSQAKRRTAAVIVDHLTPPLTRAETYGELKDLEALVDEYYEASGVDARRTAHLGREILATSARLGLNKDLPGVSTGTDNEALSAIDNHLCELKELQIRDGLHVFGLAPEGIPRRDLLVALARVPRGEGQAGNASLIRALAQDLGLGDFDPLTTDFSTPFEGPWPRQLTDVSTDLWRTAGDTVERLEWLAAALVEGTFVAPADWGTTHAVMSTIQEDLAPAVDETGTAEIAGFLTALDGRFLKPGPAGAPTRGRSDVLPTGRNFFSLDSRTLPTQAAWTLGAKSAELLVQRYVQDEGDWPKAMAISAWGTANMRTGGDDIAQALALLGVRPTWEAASRRVTGFEIVPLAKLSRPRVDVTLRVSGFFRDAFPAQIDLVDSATRAVAALDEPEEDNPLAARVAADTAAYMAEGKSAAEAERMAGSRVFGSKPGAYGAGLQALIDEGLWSSRSDFADAYLAWGSYAYGAGQEGATARDAFSRRLSSVDAIVHNQDNREHDLLDSDDYYQFEGGLAATVAELRGADVAVYHNDHSRPERPVVRTLQEEVGRVVRGRAANPKWIAGVMRHGYKGAFEIAATVDYLYAFAATTRAVGDHHFDALYDAYLDGADVERFLAENNPDALAEIAARFRDAIDREMWTPRRNSVHAHLAGLGAPGASETAKQHVAPYQEENA